MWTITGPDLDAENTFDDPAVIVPVHIVVDVATLARFRFAPRSVTWLRWHL